MFSRRHNSCMLTADYNEYTAYFFIALFSKERGFSMLNFQNVGALIANVTNSDPKEVTSMIPSAV